MLLMIESVSRFQIVTTHSRKTQNEIGDQIKNNINWVEKQFDTSVKELLMDRGKEFDNQTVESMALENGNNIIYTSTEDHQGNGRAERAIRTIIEDTKTLLLQAKLPLRFWTYAARASANVRNCLYNKNVGESPLMKISNHTVKIMLRSFLPFGAPAMIKDHTVHKTEAPGKKAITLSKDPKGYGYHFYIPKDRKIISTTNYVLPDYTIDHGAKQKNAQQDIIGTFLEEMKSKIGDISDIDFNESGILDSLPADTERDMEEVEEDNEEYLEEDELIIAKYLLDVTVIENTGNETNIAPQNFDNINLDELFEDIQVETTTENDNDVEQQERVENEKENDKMNEDNKVTSQDLENVDHKVEETLKLKENERVSDENKTEEIQIENHDAEYVPSDTEEDHDEDNINDKITNEEILELKTEEVLQHSDFVDSEAEVDDTGVFEEIKRKVNETKKIVKPSLVPPEQFETFRLNTKRLLEAVNALPEEGPQKQISVTPSPYSTDIEMGESDDEFFDTLDTPLDNNDTSDTIDKIEHSPTHGPVDETQPKMNNKKPNWTTKDFNSIQTKSNKKMAERVLGESLRSGNINHLPRVQMEVTILELGTLGLASKGVYLMLG